VLAYAAEPLLLLVAPKAAVVLSVLLYIDAAVAPNLLLSIEFLK